MTQVLADEITLIDMKISRAERFIEEKQMKIERLQHKKSKLISQIKNKTLGPEGLLERFTQKMVQAKEKT